MNKIHYAKRGRPTSFVKDLRTIYRECLKEKTECGTESAKEILVTYFRDGVTCKNCLKKLRMV